MVVPLPALRCAGAGGVSVAATLIIGGGIAGAAAAIRLAGAGARPHLIEKTQGPHDKVCGEFLSCETVDELRMLGIDPVALGARPITEMRFVSGHRSAAVPLPFPALSLSRYVLDEALLELAAKAGAKVERGTRVADEPERPSGGLFVATGKHALRGVERGRPSKVVGYKMHYRVCAQAAAALDGAVELIKLRGGYAGLQMVECGIANLCLVTSRPGRGALEDAIAETPRLAQLLGDAEARFPRPLTIAGLHYGHVAEPEPDQPGRFRLGDQAAMIPSFTGDGMGIALSTARWAAEAWAKDGAGGALAHARRVRSGVRRQVRLADGLSRLVLAPGMADVVVGVARLWPEVPRALARATRVRVPEAA